MKNSRLVLGIVALLGLVGATSEPLVASEAAAAYSTTEVDSQVGEPTSAGTEPSGLSGISPGRDAIDLLTLALAFYGAGLSTLVHWRARIPLRVTAESDGDADTMVLTVENEGVRPIVIEDCGWETNQNLLLGKWKGVSSAADFPIPHTLGPGESSKYRLVLPQSTTARRWRGYVETLRGTRVTKAKAASGGR